MTTSVQKIHRKLPSLRSKERGVGVGGEVWASLRSSIRLLKARLMMDLLMALAPESPRTEGFENRRSYSNIQSSEAR